MSYRVRRAERRWGGRLRDAAQGPPRNTGPRCGATPYSEIGAVLRLRQNAV